MAQLDAARGAGAPDGRREPHAARRPRSSSASSWTARSTEPMKAALLVALRMKGEAVGGDLRRRQRPCARRSIPIPHARHGAGGHLRHRRRRPRHLQHLDRRGAGGGGGRRAGRQARQPLGLQPLGQRRRAGRPGRQDRDRPRDRRPQPSTTVGIAFLFAPLLHPAMREVMPVRRELGLRTIFNLLGPLTNPAGARRQLMGVYTESLVEPIGHVLRDLGAEHALVVHGDEARRDHHHRPHPRRRGAGRRGADVRPRAGALRPAPRPPGGPRGRPAGGERRRHPPRLRRRDGAARATSRR